MLVFGNLIVQLKKRILNGPGNIFQMANEMYLAACQKSQKNERTCSGVLSESKHLVIYELLRILWLKVVIIYIPLTDFNAIPESPKQSSVAPAVSSIELNLHSHLHLIVNGVTSKPSVV
jgi:hypothetical protein